MFRFCFPVARIGLSAALAAAAASIVATTAFASGPSPLVGSFTETFTIVNPPPVLVAKASGSGTLTTLGPSTESFLGTVDFNTIDPKTGCAYDAAVGSITGSTGDKLFIASTGEFCPTTGVDSGHFYVTGGTGAFEGATGGGTYTSTANLSTGTSSETYNGSFIVH